MDKTRTYIEMCIKAKEIQEQWEPSLNDFAYLKDDLCDKRIVGINSCCDDEYSGTTDSIHYKKAKKDCWWLPTQEDLQKTAGIKDGYDFVHSFVDKVFTERDYMYYRNMTPNQIWLAFVMERKWNKRWNSKDWIAIK